MVSASAAFYCGDERCPGCGLGARYANYVSGPDIEYACPRCGVSWIARAHEAQIYEIPRCGLCGVLKFFVPSWDLEPIWLCSVCDTGRTAARAA